MGVEIVHDQDNLLIWKVIIHQIFQQFGKILPRSPVHDFHLPPTFKRRTHHKQIGGTVALIFKIIDRRLPKTYGERHTGFLGLLLRGLIHTDQNRVGGKLSLVNRKHVLHRIDKTALALGGMHQVCFSQGLM